MAKNQEKKSFFESPVGSFLLQNKALAILVVFMISVACISPIFLTPSNLLNLIRQIAYSAILGAGYTMILSSGHIDLSIGCEVGLVGVIMGKALVADLPIPVAILIGLVSAVLLSSLNAVLINLLDLPPFIITLATMNVFKGACYIYTKMVPVSNLPAAFNAIGQDYTFGIPNQVYIMVFMMLVIAFILYKTKFGRYSLAIGGNAEAARLSGINVKMMRIGIYALMGLYVGVAAMTLTARSASAQVSAGQNTEMDAIAAVVMGGTPMSGGSANVVGTFFGCLIVGVINNGLNLLGVDSNWQLVAKGLMILFAISLDVISTNVTRNMSKKKMA